MDIWSPTTKELYVDISVPTNNPLYLRTQINNKKTDVNINKTNLRLLRLVDDIYVIDKKVDISLSKAGQSYHHK